MTRRDDLPAGRPGTSMGPLSVCETAEPHRRFPVSSHSGSVSECSMQDDVDGVGSAVILGAALARWCHAYHHGKESSPCPDPPDPLRFDRLARGETTSCFRAVSCIVPFCRALAARGASVRRRPPCRWPLREPFCCVRPRTLAVCCRRSAIWHVLVVVPLLVIAPSLLAPCPFPSGAWGHFGPWPCRVCGVGAHGLGAVCVTARIATWLILPVVICLSQRLSHACVSINSLVL